MHMEQPRAPIVTILGHVDHGKTTLLDFIRKTAVAAKEHGGITQAIGAYQVEAEGKKITFIDTPGHAAFEKMRSRGAQVADIAVLVVAVEDGVMPQTVEAIKHIQSANVPMIVAANKIDLPGIDVKVQLEKLKKQLSDNKVLVEEYGGDVPLVPLSAKTGKGVDELLSMINLVAEMHELKADETKPAAAVVIESHLDKYKGPLATLIIKDGTLKKGDKISMGSVEGKVKGMFDFNGVSLEKAGPSTPVEVLGFESTPPVGAKSGEEAAAKRESDTKTLVERLRESGEEVLNVVVKADKEGSLEAIEGALEEFNKEKAQIKILSAGTGEIDDGDIKIGMSGKAVVIGFNIGIRPTAQRLAETEHVLVRNYTVIYELIDEMKEVVEGILKPGVVEEVFGRAQIVAEFPFGKSERIAGCKVLEGQISKGPKVRIVRGDPSTSSGQVIVGEGKIKSLKKVREEVSKVEKGQECGMIFDNLDFQVGDLVESFRVI